MPKYSYRRGTADRYIKGYDLATLFNENGFPVTTTYAANIKRACDAMNKTMARYTDIIEALKWATAHLIVLYGPKGDKMVETCISALHAIGEDADPMAYAHRKVKVDYETKNGKIPAGMQMWQEFQLRLYSPKEIEQIIAMLPKSTPKKRTVKKPTKRGERRTPKPLTRKV